MRTTVDLKPDVIAALQQHRRLTGEGLSEAINALLRSALIDAPRSALFRQRAAHLGVRTDVRNIGEVLEVLDQR